MTLFFLQNCKRCGGGTLWTIAGMCPACVEARIAELKAENGGLLSEIEVQELNENVTQNQLDEAVEHIAELEAEVVKLKEKLALVEGSLDKMTDGYQEIADERNGLKAVAEAAKRIHERILALDWLTLSQELARETDALRAAGHLEDEA